MELLDTLEVISSAGKHKIELYHGNVANLPVEHAVDLLVVSAFPNDYSPTPTSVIGALSKSGINVSELARNKAADLRESFSCWISKDLQTQISNIPFKRLLVFEPLIRGRPSDVVGDIFQSIMPFIHVDPYIRSIAMPLVATGDQGIKPERIFIPLIHAAINWFLLGLPVEVIKIVEYSKTRALELKGALGVLKQQYVPYQRPKKSKSDFNFDFFISYSHEDYKHIDFLYDRLSVLAPDIRVFMDKRNLRVGSAWQQELYEKMDECEKVISVYSPTYINSKVCKEEFNIGLMRHREEGNVLVPIYLRSTKLPTYMKLIQFIDCREANEKRIEEACKQLATQSQI